MFKLDLEKAEEPETKLPTSVGSSTKQESSRKIPTSALLTRPKPMTVDHSKLWKILKEMGIPDHLTCLIRNLYVDQEKAVRILYGTSDWLKTEKTVYQSCISSASLFSLYAEYIMQSAGLDEFTSWSQDCWEKY